MEKIKILILSVLIIGTLSSCYFETDKSNQYSDVRGAIMPHHLLVDFEIDNLYKNISSNNSYDRIIIISPNHFNYGYNFIQSTNNSVSETGFPVLDEFFIESLSVNKALFVEPFHFNREHGISSHVQFIKKYFPDVKIIPIIIKNDTPLERIKYLSGKLIEIDLSKTLIIASIDFSHYADEKFAYEDDYRIIDWLETIYQSDLNTDSFQDVIELAKSSDHDNKGAIAMDSPETLYLFVDLMKRLESVNFKLINRTSTASLSNISDPSKNTSHIFGIFSPSIIL